jgi:hypothetical protein
VPPKPQFFYAHDVTTELDYGHYLRAIVHDNSQKNAMTAIIDSRMYNFFLA